MSTEYNSGVMFGIFLSKEEVESMMVTVPEKSDMVPCHDKRTGKRLPDEKVVAYGEHKALIVDGVRYSYQRSDESAGYVHDGVEALAKKIGLISVGQQDSWGDTYGYVIGYGINEVGAVAAIKRIKATGEKLKKLPQLIASYGVKIKLPQAEVHSYLVVG